MAQLPWPFFGYVRVASNIKQNCLAQSASWQLSRISKLTSSILWSRREKSTQSPPLCLSKIKQNLCMAFPCANGAEETCPFMDDWLVVDLPLWKMVGGYYSQYMEKQMFQTTNHMIVLWQKGDLYVLCLIAKGSPLLISCDVWNGMVSHDMWSTLASNHLPSLKGMFSPVIRFECGIYIYCIFTLYYFMLYYIILYHAILYYIKLY